MSTVTINNAGSVIVANYNTTTAIITYTVTLPSGSKVTTTRANFSSRMASLRDAMVNGTSDSVYGIPASDTDISSLNSIIAEVPVILDQTATLGNSSPAVDENSTDGLGGGAGAGGAGTGGTGAGAGGAGTGGTGAGGQGSSRGLQGNTLTARASRTAQDNSNAERQTDWRVKLSLAPNTDALYLYKATNPGILKPLQETDGVIFPYTPQISVAYAASYEPQDVVHSNYKIFQYKNSSVDSITITCDFTAQDTVEANYLLAVIHFFRSVTKMFYGKDQTPKNGTPPPLCYLSGLGEFQFNAHPLVISGFTYNLPNNVDYIRALVRSDAPAGSNSSASNIQNNTNGNQRLTGVGPGGNPDPTDFQNNQMQNTGSSTLPTYVPTQMQLSIQCIPIVTRNAISSYFSLEKYATGQLLLGNKRQTGDFYGGIW